MGGVAGAKSFVLIDRSVAVDASGRRGNDASEIIEARDVCRGCGVNVCADIATVGRLVLAVVSEHVKATRSYRDLSWLRTS